MGVRILKQPPEEAKMCACGGIGAASERSRPVFPGPLRLNARAAGIPRLCQGAGDALFLVSAPASLPENMPKNAQ